MKGVKLAIFLGITLVAAGAAFVGVAYATHSFKGAEIVTNEHKIETEFKNFDFDIDTANVEFVSTTEDTAKVTCIEKAKWSQRSENRDFKKFFDMDNVSRCWRFYNWSSDYWNKLKKNFDGIK